MNRKKIRNYWKNHEKKALLMALNEVGPRDIQQIAQRIPTRTEDQIRKYLRRSEKSALIKFKSKKQAQVQDSFSHIHPWMSFINIHCNTQAYIHDHMTAYILPILEKYEKTFAKKSDGINFRAAYRALFSALTMQKFPDDLDGKTFSMLYASMKQLLKEVSESEDESHKKVLAECVKRHFSNSNTDGCNESNRNDTLQLPEVNVLGFIAEELRIICE